MKKNLEGRKQALNMVSSLCTDKSEAVCDVINFFRDH